MASEKFKSLPETDKLMSFGSLEAIDASGNYSQNVPSLIVLAYCAVPFHQRKNFAAALRVQKGININQCIEYERVKYLGAEQEEQERRALLSWSRVEKSIITAISAASSPMESGEVDLHSLALSSIIEDGVALGLESSKVEVFVREIINQNT